MKTKLKIWVDEAGRGPWFWPVVAASFCINPNNPPGREFLQKLKDSKKLSEKQREKIFEEIVKMSISLWSERSALKSIRDTRVKHEYDKKKDQITLDSSLCSEWQEQQPKIFFWVGVVDNQYIDEHNIRQATREAMRRSLVEILRKINIWKKDAESSSAWQNWSGYQIESVVVDGKDNFVFEELEKKPIYIIWWDAKVIEISAASIVAKVFRDKLTKTYGELYPHLELEKHKWYGTKAHSEKLQTPPDITGFHRQSYKPIQSVLQAKPKLLLHVCCWPDATIPIVDLKKEYEVIGFWYDPNIQPKKEYDKRLRAFKKVCKIEGIECIEGEYDVKNFFKKIKWLEHTPEKWEKCTECYDMRLERTAKLASQMWITFWTSTLNTSPHKDLEKIFELGEKHSQPHPSPLLEGEGIEKKLKFLKIAFRKNNGFLRSVEYTKKYKIYRQDYCGCVYSDTFPGSSKREKLLKKWEYNWG